MCLVILHINQYIVKVFFISQIQLHQLSVCCNNLTNNFLVFDNYIKMFHLKLKLLLVDVHKNTHDNQLYVLVTLCHNIFFSRNRILLVPFLLQAIPLDLHYTIVLLCVMIILGLLPNQTHSPSS
jgi:hypothetical protein